MLKIVIALELLLVISSSLASASEVGFYCTKGEECAHFASENVNVSCLEGSCNCYNNHTFVNTECRPKIIRTNNIIGGPCTPCSLPHSECNRRDLICYCEDGYMPIERNRRCAPEEVPLGEICEIDEQCMAINAFSHCANDSKSCTCNVGFYQHDGTCLARTKLRTKCSDGLKCMLHGLHLVCIPGAFECVCEPGFISSNTTGECIPERSYKGECNITEQCQGIMGTGASCIEGKCFCEKEYEVVKMKHTEKLVCKRLAVIGQYCKTPEHCHNGNATNENQLMECNRGECVCRFGIKNKPPCLLSMASSLIASKVTLWFMLFMLIYLIYVQRY